MRLIHSPSIRAPWVMSSSGATAPLPPTLQSHSKPTPTFSLCRPLTAVSPHQATQVLVTYSWSRLTKAGIIFSSGLFCSPIPIMAAARGDDTQDMGETHGCGLDRSSRVSAPGLFLGVWRRPLPCGSQSTQVQAVGCRPPSLPPRGAGPPMADGLRGSLRRETGWREEETEKERQGT